MPKQQSAKDRVVAVLEKVQIVDPAQCTPGAHLQRDLSCDSLDLVEIVMLLEEECDIVIADEEAEAVQTVMDLVALVERKMQIHGSSQQSATNGKTAIASD